MPIDAKMYKQDESSADKSNESNDSGKKSDDDEAVEGEVVDK